MPSGLAVIPDCLLLGYARVFGEPFVAVFVCFACPEKGEVFLRLCRAERLAPFVSCLGFVHHAVPYVSTCVPFGNQVLFRLFAGA